MKTIIDSIVKAEHDVQKNYMEAEKEAKTLIDEARAKTVKLEDEYQKKFEDEVLARKEDMKLRAEKRVAELKTTVEKELKDKKSVIEKKRGAIKEKIIKMVLEK
ncbi:MAG: hypothetical protein A2Y33_01960 [Spirochaetes bacterium GWF1_51_8]|nr:MAG: hypothetical protein A2Y33_01960 [Spirochaetes bacterium GWF1_51_8]